MPETNWSKKKKRMTQTSKIKRKRVRASQIFVVLGHILGNANPYHVSCLNFFLTPWMYCSCLRRANRHAKTLRRFGKGGHWWATRKMAAHLSSLLSLTLHPNQNPKYKLVSAFSPGRGAVHTPFPPSLFSLFLNGAGKMIQSGPQETCPPRPVRGPRGCWPTMRQRSLPL